MQILGAGKKPLTLTVLCSSLALLAGCGGTTVFSSQNPVTIAGELPAPPPPPPPPPVEAPKPPEPPPKVVVKDNKIEITEKIQFEYNKAVILPASFALLQEIADTIKKNPHIKKIAIEGHASSEGGQAHNLKLSDERAKSVMKHLVDQGGLKTEMFTAKGYGSQKPIADNANDEGKEKNRRVEFNIIEQDVTKKKVAVDNSGKETVLEEKTAAEKKELQDAAAPEKDKDDKKKAKKEEKKEERKAEQEEKKKKDEKSKELK